MAWKLKKSTLFSAEIAFEAQHRCMGWRRPGMICAGGAVDRKWLDDNHTRHGSYGGEFLQWSKISLLCIIHPPPPTPIHTEYRPKCMRASSDIYTKYRLWHTQTHTQNLSQSIWFGLVWCVCVTAYRGQRIQSEIRLFFFSVMQS